MNEQNRRRPQSVVGGADMRARGQMPLKTREQRLEGIRPDLHRREAPRREEYSQMPLRPMTAMPREERRQPHPQQRPPVQGQRPPMQGQRPPMQGQRPPMQGQRPPMQGQRPPMQGQRPPMQGQRPPMQGQRPPVREQARPARPTNNQRPPEKRPNNGWVIPEGSPVYTAEGIMYERQRPAAPDPRRGKGQPRRPDRAPERGQGRGVDSRYGSTRRHPRREAPPKKTFDKEKILFWIKTFFIRLAAMLVIVSLIGFLWYRGEFYSETEARKGKVTFSLDGVGSYTAKADLAYRGDVLYCDFTEIAKWLGMVSVGSVNSMRFICTEGVSETSSGKGGEEYAIFTSGSTTVQINGVTVILEAPCRTVDSHIWIPLSFVENYVSGVTCDRGAKGTDISFSPEGSDPEESKEDEEIVIKASYKVKAQNAIAHVAYPEEEQNG